MQLEHFKFIDNYIVELDFKNGMHKKVDLELLIKSKVTKEELKTARIDKEWGCLEFKQGMVDIEPKTLYKFAQGKQNATK
jgi:uncharacterized membrane protein YcaP (DUF421 family)